MVGSSTALACANCSLNITQLLTRRWGLYEGLHIHPQRRYILWLLFGTLTSLGHDLSFRWAQHSLLMGILYKCIHIIYLMYTFFRGRFLWPLSLRWMLVLIREDYLYFFLLLGCYNAEVVWLCLYPIKHAISLAYIYLSNIIRFARFVL